MEDVLIRTIQNVVTLQVGHEWGSVPVYRVCIGTLERNGPYGRSRLRCEDIINVSYISKQ